MGSCLGKEEDHPKRKCSASNDENRPLNINENHSSSESSLTKTDPCVQSLVKCRLFDDPNPPECPYCGQSGADKSNMIICNSPTLSYEMFQKLMVRGWWRTGNVIFSPRADEICCPSYAIRMRVADYQLTKKHKRVLNMWKDFLINGDQRWENRNQQKAGLASICVATVLLNEYSLKMHSNPNTETGAGEGHHREGVKKLNNKRPIREGTGPDPNKPPCRKAKDIRAERRRAKTDKEKSATKHVPPPQRQETLLELFENHKRVLESNRDSCKHKMEVKLIGNNSLEMIQTLQELYDLYVRFQDAVHPGQPRFMSPDALYWGFIESPLEPLENNSRPLGTHHMRYYLDDELVMVSVLDILPEYLVSIYFIYDPDIRFLQPGIYTCLKEIQLILQLQESRPELQYYNLGFYNDFSPKINYKRQFKPTEILCPITGTYVPLEHVIPLLKQNRYCRFAKDDVPDSSAVVSTDSDLDSMLICPFSGVHDTYQHYHQLPGDWKALMKPVLQRYLQQMGSDVMREMLVTL